MSRNAPAPERTSTATLRPHSRITLMNTRPVTKADVAFVLDELRARWPDADLVPEPITEGGLAIWCGDVYGVTSQYKTVRFTGSEVWPMIQRGEDTVSTWRDVNQVVVKWTNHHAAAYHQRSVSANAQEVGLCCKCNTNAPAWTKNELEAVADALILSGAFAKGRRAKTALRW